MTEDPPEILRVAGAEAVSVALGERRNFKISEAVKGGHVTFTANVWPSEPGTLTLTLTNIRDWREHRA